MANKLIQLSDGTNNLYPAQPEQSTTIDLSLSGQTFTGRSLKRVGRMVSLFLDCNGSTAFSSAASGDTIGTLPEGYRPAEAVYIPVMGRNSGTWGTATYYMFYAVIDPDGNIKIFGKTTDLQACRYIRTTVTFLAAE